MVAHDVSDDAGRQARIEQRTNIFVLATVVSPTASAPVRVRNLSPGGALIEGAALPRAGEHVHLVRGEISARGTVVWCGAGRAGLRLEGQINIAEWIPGGNPGQQRVDRIVQHARAGAVPLESDERSSARRVAVADLELLAVAVDALSNALAEDPLTVARFGTKLQTLDVVSQTLRRLHHSAD